MKHFGFILLWIFTVPAYAATITAKADKMDLFHHESRLLLNGHVEVSKPDLLLKSDKMTIDYFDENGRKKVKQATAEGSVQIETEGHEGWADQAVYHAERELLVLTGNAKVKSSQGIVAGEKIEYNMVTKETQVIKGDADEQVRITFGEDSD